MARHTWSLALKLFGVSLVSLVFGWFTRETMNMIPIIIGVPTIYYLSALAITSEVKRMISAEK